VTAIRIDYAVHASGGRPRQSNAATGRAFTLARFGIIGTLSEEVNLLTEAKMLS
jgi:hypothetical protein